MSDYLIGIDLGGTRIKAVAVTPQGHEYSRAHASTDDSEGDMAWRGKVQSLVAGFTNEFGSPAAIGLSAPGLAARDARSISYMPGRLQGLENFDWSDYLQAPVRVLNDAHAALLGEAWLARSREAQRFLADAGHRRWRRDSLRWATAARHHRARRTSGTHHINPAVLPTS
jgi:glucokinase